MASKNNGIDGFIEQKMLDVNRDIEKTIVSTNNKMFREAVSMYDSFIDQYYEYKTKEYIRHDENRAGTGVGHSLYLGQDIRKESGRKPTLSIYVPGDSGYQNDMEGIYDYSNGDSPTDILYNVMHGVRGVPGYWIEFWNGNYNGKYFSFNGTMQRAFETFEDYFDDIAEEVFFEDFEKLGY